MDIVKIHGYIDNEIVDVSLMLDKASKKVNDLSTIDKIIQSNTFTKLYYIAPRLNKLYIVVDEYDASLIGTDTLLEDIDIASFPLERLPNSIVTYKELIIGIESKVENQEILDASQAIIDDTNIEVLPNSLVVVKIIDYRVNEVRFALSNIFIEPFLSTLTTIETEGVSEDGFTVIEWANAIVMDVIEEIKIVNDKPTIYPSDIVMDVIEEIKIVNDKPTIYPSDIVMDVIEEIKIVNDKPTIYPSDIVMDVIEEIKITGE